MTKRSIVIIVILSIVTSIAGWWLAQPVAPSDVRDVPRTTAQKVRLSPPRSPAPRVDALPPAKPDTAKVPAKPEGPLARLFADREKAFKLTATQLQGYLSANKRNAESLLAALRLTGDLQFLQEAARNLPQDASVQLELALRSGDSGERLRALEAMRQADPENALADYLSAVEHLRGGDPTSAFDDLTRAPGKGRLDSYSATAIQSAEEAYLTAGYPPVEAKAAAMMGVAIREAEPLRELAKSLEAIQKAYSGSGDAASAESVRLMGQALGQQIQAEAPFFIHELIGMGIEKKFVDAASGSTREQEIRERSDYIRSLIGNPKWEALMHHGSAADLSLYLDRQKLFGEEAAMRWWIAR